MVLPRRDANEVSACRLSIGPRSIPMAKRSGVVAVEEAAHGLQLLGQRGPPVPGQRRPGAGPPAFVTLGQPDQPGAFEGGKVTPQVAVRQSERVLEVTEVGPLGLLEHDEDGEAVGLVHHLVELGSGMGTLFAQIDRCSARYEASPASTRIAPRAPTTASWVICVRKMPPPGMTLLSSWGPRSARTDPPGRSGRRPPPRRRQR